MLNFLSYLCLWLSVLGLNVLIFSLRKQVEELEERINNGK